MAKEKGHDKEQRYELPRPWASGGERGVGRPWILKIAVLRPVAQLYGQVRTDWNQCFVAGPGF